jgi:arylformamidase
MTGSEGTRRIHDISVILGVESVDYPGDTPYVRESLQNAGSGGTITVSKLIMSAHSGTHIDAPSHFIPGGKSIDRYTVADFVIPALVVETGDEDAITASALKGCDIREGDALLFKTGNSRTGRARGRVFSQNFVYLSEEAAHFCVERRVRLVGIDYATIDGPGKEHHPVHRILLERGVLILEGLNLHRIDPLRYTLLCLPLSIQDGEASPVRAVLIEEGKSGVTDRLGGLQ